MFNQDIWDDSYVDPEIEEYIDFLNFDEQDTTGFLTRQRVLENIDKIGEVLNLFMVYPDKFVDLITPKQSHFKLFFFQRIILRCMARGIQTFASFSRGTSKSFLADLDRYLHCMFIPHHHTSITAGTNKQAAEIAKQKVLDDLWVKFPLLSNEMQKRKIAGKIQDAYKMGQDYIEFRFKNGSSLDLGNVRGLRRDSLILEEVIEQDETKVNEVYIPLLNKPRNMINGLINPHEPQSQQIYITTAGFQGTFAYQKIIETACRAAIEPDKYFALSGSYRIPLACGLVSKHQIQNTINSPTYSRESFAREYESVWSDAPMGAAFSSNTVSALRQVKRIELKNMLTAKQKEDGCFYVVCADMSKDGSAQTAVGVAKIIPQEHNFTYKFVNLFNINTSDYMSVANIFKETVLTYDAKLLIYDANGVGAGIRDWLNKETVNAKGMPLEGLGIINPPTTSARDVIRYPKHRTICYEIKSGGKVGETIHWFFFSRMSTGAITFPLKLTEALNLYAQNESFCRMSKAKQEEYFMPFKTMERMEAELKNLDIVNTSDRMTNSLKLIRRNAKINKDFFSMAEYLVWGVNQYFELEFYKRKRSNLDDRWFVLID